MLKKAENNIFKTPKNFFKTEPLKNHICGLPQFYFSRMSFLYTDKKLPLQKKYYIYIISNRKNLSIGEGNFLLKKIVKKFKVFLKKGLTKAKRCDILYIVPRGNDVRS